MYQVEYLNGCVQVPACIIEEREVEIIDDSTFNIIFSNVEPYRHWGTLQDNLVFPTQEQAIACLLTLKEAELKKLKDASSLVEKQIKDLRKNLNSLLPK